MSVAQAKYNWLTERLEDFRAQRRREHEAMLGPTVVKLRPPFVPYYQCGERMPRTRKGNGVSVADATFWLDMCNRLCRDADDFDSDTRRGWTIACRLLGLGWSERERALYDTACYGAAAAAKHWAPYLSVPDQRYVGFVYVAVAPSRPTILKVGFSTQPVRRMEQLSRIEKTPVQAVVIHPGTMLHEWSFHQHGRHPVKPEWYPSSTIPGWITEPDSTASIPPEVAADAEEQTHSSNAGSSAPIQPETANELRKAAGETIPADQPRARPEGLPEIGGNPEANNSNVTQFARPKTAAEYRTHCQNPSACAGQGRAHCFTCDRAHAAGNIPHQGEVG